MIKVGRTGVAFIPVPQFLVSCIGGQRKGASVKPGVISLPRAKDLAGCSVISKQGVAESLSKSRDVAEVTCNWNTECSRMSV